MKEHTEHVRVKKSIKNLLYGSISQFMKSFLGFLVRIVLVRTLGLQAASLNGLFTEVITMLSLAEMGVGQAIVYNLYVPLRENDEKKLTELMNLFKTAYRIVAFAILAIGLALTPFIHLLINKVEIDMGYLRLIYILFLVQTASSYLFSYKQSLLNADQKYYLVSKYSLYVRTAFSFASVAFLLITKNYIVYLLIQIAMNLATNIVISMIADRLYPFLNKKGTLPKEERKSVLSNVKHLFIGSLSAKITNSTDNILISLLVGTLSIGAYSSYTLIINSMTRILEQLSSATMGSIGNLMAEGDKEYMDVVLKRLTFINFCPAMIGAVVFLCTSTPLVWLMFGKIYVMKVPVVYMCSFNFFLLILRNPLWQVMKVSGLFAKDKNTSIAGSAVNLVVSVIFGMKLGIFGILLGTTCTHVIQMVLKSRILYREYLGFSGKSFNLQLVKYSFCCGFSLLAVGAVCSKIDLSHLYTAFFVRGSVSFVLVTLIICVIFGRTDEFKYALETGKGMLLKFIPHKK
ncbi:MAG: lipopolysaccharide biosynthesis protein [Eubacterium sp.]|nr:lipopolysaccharide biosynthesis protein [Eubacterium sp.]